MRIRLPWPVSAGADSLAFDDGRGAGRLRLAVAASVAGGILALAVALASDRAAAPADGRVRLAMADGADVDALVAALRRAPEIAALELRQVGTDAGGTLEPAAGPAQVELTLSAATGIDPDALARRLQDLVPAARILPAARVPEHDGARLWRLAAATTGTLLLAGAIVAAGPAVRAGRERGRGGADLMQLLGASDRFVAGAIGRAARRRTLEGALLGWLAALCVLALAVGRPETGLSLTLRPADWLLTALLPPLIAFAAGEAARRRALRRLTRLA